MGVGAGGWALRGWRRRLSLPVVGPARGPCPPSLLPPASARAEGVCFMFTPRRNVNPPPPHIHTPGARGATPSQCAGSRSHREGSRAARARSAGLWLLERTLHFPSSGTVPLLLRRYSRSPAGRTAAPLCGESPCGERGTARGCLAGTAGGQAAGGPRRPGPGPCRCGSAACCCCCCCALGRATFRSEIRNWKQKHTCSRRASRRESPGKPEKGKQPVTKRPLPAGRHQTHGRGRGAHARLAALAWGLPAGRGPVRRLRSTLRRASLALTRRQSRCWGAAGGGGRGARQTEGDWMLSRQPGRS